MNDWPYALDPEISHVVVWSKTPIAVDDEKGDVTDESRAVIEAFVERFFTKKLEGNAERVMWFKNWVSLQSVRGVDHAHVLARGVPDEVLEGWLEEPGVEVG